MNRRVPFARQLAKSFEHAIGAGEKVWMADELLLEQGVRYVALPRVTFEGEENSFGFYDRQARNGHEVEMDQGLSGVPCHRNASNPKGVNVGWISEGGVVHG